MRHSRERVAASPQAMLLDSCCSQSSTLLLLSPLCPASFLRCANASDCGCRHLASFAAGDGDNSVPLGLGPASTLSFRNPSPTRSRNPTPAAARFRQERDSVGKTLNLRRETAAFLLQLPEYGGEVCHAGILAASPATEAERQSALDSGFAFSMLSAIPD